MINARARDRDRVRARDKARPSERVRVMDIFWVRAVAESRASVSVRLCLGPGLGQG